MFSFNNNQPASLLIHNRFADRGRSGEGLVLLVTSRRLYNHIPSELKPIHCGSLFRSAKSSSSGEKSYLYYLYGITTIKLLLGVQSWMSQTAPLVLLRKEVLNSNWNYVHFHIWGRICASSIWLTGQDVFI